MIVVIMVIYFVSTCQSSQIAQPKNNAFKHLKLTLKMIVIIYCVQFYKFVVNVD